MTTPENKIKKAVDKILKYHGVWFFSPQAGPYGRAGVPDRIAIAWGVPIGIECKADKKKTMTALQDREALAITAAGGVFFLVYDTPSALALDRFLRGVRAYRESNAGYSRKEEADYRSKET